MHKHHVKNYFRIIIGASIVISAGFPVFGAAPDVETSFRHFFDLETLPLSVPTVVEIPVTSIQADRYEFAVQQREGGVFEPYHFSAITYDTAFTARVAGVGDAHLMTDKKAETYTEFASAENKTQLVEIALTSAEPVTAEAITILLDNNVALPLTVSLDAVVNGTTKVIITQKRLAGTTIAFPRTRAAAWTLRFSHVQPLRIAEIRFAQERSASWSRSLRFLAQPGTVYRVYVNPDRYVAVPVGESGDLAGASDVLRIELPALQQNVRFREADIDEDTIPDIHDNCIAVKNTDQKDEDGNSQGDACDDFDVDGLINSIDNCPNMPNRDQDDEDSDGVGDPCDGAENRVTERLPWLPWAGIGFAVAIVLTLFTSLMRGKKPPPPTTPDTRHVWKK